MSNSHNDLLREQKEENKQEGNSMNHTPTPWKTEWVNPETYLIMGDFDGLTYDLAKLERNAKANAEFIVKACNAHEEVKSLLEAVRYHLQGECGHNEIEDCNAEICALNDKALSLLAGVNV